MRRLLALVTMSLALMVGGAVAPDVPGLGFPGSPSVAEAHTCNSGGYTHAVINGAHKCLRNGQFCTHSADSQYRKYGFRCTKKNSGGRYMLTSA